MKKSANNKLDKNNLMTLLFLLMIFSMYLVLKLHSLPNYLNISSVIDSHKTIYSIIIVPLAMGIALLFCAIRSENKSLKYIYLISILPFITSPDVLYLFNQLFILIFNIIITFLIILIILRYISSALEP